MSSGFDGRLSVPINAAMAMRELVTGGAACAVQGSSSSSNPLGALANSIIGSSSKQHERLKELPGTTVPTQPDNSFYSGTGHLTTLPGLENDQQHHQQHHRPDAPASEFFTGFQSGSAETKELKKEELISGLLFPHNFGCCFHRLQQVMFIMVVRVLAIQGKGKQTLSLSPNQIFAARVQSTEH